MALGAFKLRFGAETLDLFKTVAALGAAISIQGQDFPPPVQNQPLPLLYRQTGNSPQNTDLPNFKGHGICRTWEKPAKRQAGGSLPAQTTLRRRPPHGLAACSFKWPPAHPACRSAVGLITASDFQNPHIASQCMLIGTVALWFSQARFSIPLPPPSSVIFQTRFSTISGGLLIVIFVLPRSLVLS
jgi:hypothetical protein